MPIPNLQCFLIDPCLLPRSSSTDSMFCAFKNCNPIPLWTTQCKLSSAQSARTLLPFIFLLCGTKRKPQPSFLLWRRMNFIMNHSFFLFLLRMSTVSPLTVGLKTSETLVQERWMLRTHSNNIHAISTTRIIPGLTKQAVDFNTRWNLPSKSIFPETPLDVVEAVKLTSANDVKISIKNSGHSWVQLFCSTRLLHLALAFSFPSLCPFCPPRPNNYSGSSTLKGSLLLNMRKYQRYADSSITSCDWDAAAYNVNDPCKLTVARGKPGYMRVGEDSGSTSTYVLVTTLLTPNCLARGSVGFQSP